MNLKLAKEEVAALDHQVEDKVKKDAKFFEPFKLISNICKKLRVIYAKLI